MESRKVACSSHQNQPCVFITGISGKLGEVLCKRLCDQGFKCKGLVRDEDAKKEVQGLGCTDVFVGDLTKLQTDDFVKYLEGCDFVIDAAGSTSGKDIEKIEFTSGKFLAQAAMKSNVKKYISMSAVGCDHFSSGERKDALVCDKCDLKLIVGDLKLTDQLYVD
ncbi:predicted protein [Naegleria gruberi]|uniref:Predicted protein n=1 Tax=Naegleria gruberi TaxID=5762 RepID=D2W4J2_NAEGR|nr:uncharacterized protein NAEGRDRAFT_76326 [Naegleria gruberi]EFC36012.1 predicted protein [Naegleria gruberi]|eukprot:XP_002668756.1 predicted protein [Naegleria gruberi strain NEG-M]